MNKFEDAFKTKRNLTRNDTEFLVALTKYLNYGGTFVGAHALIDYAAHETGKNGQFAGAECGQKVSADLPRPMPSEGLSRIAEGHRPSADARPPLPAGQAISAHQGHVFVASGQPVASAEAKSHVSYQTSSQLPSARDPSDLFREELRRDRMQTAAIWLERTKTSDGRYWSKVHPREFVGMQRDAEVIRQIKLLYGEFSLADQNKELGQILSPDLIKKLARRMEKYNAIAS